jgi:uncharacterized protein YggT (Ycf19 family)
MAGSHIEVTRRQQSYETDSGRVDRAEVEHDYKPSKSRVGVNIVYLLASVIAGMLAIRFILSLLGANQGSPFGSFMYAVTQPLVAPFYGLFGTQMVYGQSRLELETLVAIGVYALVAWAIIRVLLIDQPRSELSE